MSAVIHRTRKHYLKSLLIEAVLMILFCILVFMWKDLVVIDFSIGMLIGYFPHISLVYFVFFRNNLEIKQKITALYYGEALKWLITILLMVLSFKLITDLNVVALLAGYILLIVLNNLVPFLLSSVK